MAINLCFCRCHIPFTFHKQTVEVVVHDWHRTSFNVTPNCRTHRCRFRDNTAVVLLMERLRCSLCAAWRVTGSELPHHHIISVRVLSLDDHRSRDKHVLTAKTAMTLHPRHVRCSGTGTEQWLWSEVIMFSPTRIVSRNHDMHSLQGCSSLHVYDRYRAWRYYEVRHRSGVEIQRWLCSYLPYTTRAHLDKR